MRARCLLTAFVAIALSITTIAAQSPGYNQPYRPQVHFSPQEHWTNDPNGLVYFHGEYHLFYQYNPFGDEWGHMSWGHAVSTDLLHWRELPIAIPERDGVMVFTGSVVVDRQNSSGLCSLGTECLIAIYTGDEVTSQETRQTQNIAYSRDDGRTWTRYQHNPVIDLHMADFRDPSVFWDHERHHWLMAVSLPKEHKVRFYSSRNLKQWSQLSDFGPAGDQAGDWECPDLLYVPSVLKNGGGAWALKIGLNPGAPQGGSGEQYFLGEFNGTSFIPSREAGSHGWTDYGKDDYCAISFNGLPKYELPVLMGWMNNWQYAAKLPTSPWRGQMSLPRRLSLVKDDAGMALKQDPIIAPLQAGRTSISVTTTEDSNIASLETPFELDLQFMSSSEQAFGIRLYSDEQHWTEIGFDRNNALFYVDRTHSGKIIGSGFSTVTKAPLVSVRPFDLKLVVDRSSIEAFAQNGTIAMTDLIFPPSPNTHIELFSKGGQAVTAIGEYWKLDSIWK